MPLVVAIDGPAGAGKSTVARRVADALSLTLVDTGAIYRAVALLALRNGVAIDDGDALGEIARELDIQFQMDGDINRVRVFDEDVTAMIRTPDVAMAASSVSRHPQVRSALLALQRSYAERTGAVLEGRDIGTVVLPNAQVKVFLDASPEERARRRYEELQSLGDQSCTFEDVLVEVEQRDEQDRNRSVAPLKPASDARVLDSTSMSVDEVVASIVAAVGELT
ncbi:MAG: (d)CMP kinase [Myxococcota bacterium]